MERGREAVRSEPVPSIPQVVLLTRRVRRRPLTSLVLAAAATALVVAGCGQVSDTASASAAAAAERSPDDAVSAAAAALAQGQAWRATRLVAPALADSARRTPEALYLAATAAGEWGGWREVHDLLDGREWLDTLYQGGGRALLARASLELGGLDSAASYARAALGAARDSSVAGERLVVLARALDRLGRRAEAADAYAAAAVRLPLVGDWLFLRAAAATDDPPLRRARLDALRHDAVYRRAPDAEAEARERSGDRLGAARLLDSLGDPAGALRLRLLAATDSAAPDSAAADSARAQLLALVRTRSGTATARAAVAALDGDPAGLALIPRDELLVARSLARSGPLPRAVAAYERAFNAGLGTADDRFAHADALARMGLHEAAAAAFAAVPPGARRAADAAYLRARSLVRAGRTEEGRALLPSVVESWPFDTSAAATALYLAADLASDDRDEAAARRLFLELAARYPTSAHAGAARFRAATIALLAGHPDSAARELDSLAGDRWSEAGAARYWAGRAWEAAGDTASARWRWRLALRRDPLSYYALLSARRLGAAVWVPAAAADSFAPFPAADSALDRARLLAQLGLTSEAAREHEALVRAAGDSVPLLLAAADAFREAGHGSMSIRLAQRALDRGAPRDARTYRLLYPVTHDGSLAVEAADHRLDPALVAALIRQESWFDPAATSPAGARGLMQIMPDVGGTLAEAAGLPVWDPVLLWHGEVSLQLGTMHLRDLHDRYPETVRVLAAYNAGASRVDRWAGKVGSDDPEVFAERIPFTETRDYVRIIQRSRELYRALYEWPAPVATGRIDSLPPPRRRG
jgi:soluble lytic murein transglycosylase